MVASIARQGTDFDEQRRDQPSFMYNGGIFIKAFRNGTSMLPID